MTENGGTTELSLGAVIGGMAGTHRIFRRELPLSARLIGEVAPGDTERAATLAEHLRLILELIHIHHVAEERYLWDLLPERAPDDRAIVDTMLEQHAAVAREQEALLSSLERWERSVDPGEQGELAATVQRFADGLVAHADLEEAETPPLIARELTAQEWGAFVGYASTAMPEEVRGTVMGMLIEDMPEAERNGFLAALPPPVAERLTTTGAEQYAAYTAKIRGN